METVIDLDELETEVRDALERDDRVALRAMLRDHHPADVADVIDRLPDDERLTTFRQLPPELAAGVLSETGLDATRRLLDGLSRAEVQQIFRRMSYDDIVEILGEDAPSMQEDILTALSATTAQQVRALLSYPPRSAGRLLVDRYVRAGPELTVAETFVLLRRVAAAVESVHDIFIVDAEGRLQGVVPIAVLLAAPPEQRIIELADREPVTVQPETDQEEVARLVSQYDLLTLPVIDAADRMLGVITVDDVIDVLIQESTEDVLRLGAVPAGRTDESYFDVPVRQVLQRRIGWLLLLFVTGLLTVNVLGQFEAILAQVVALQFFIPLLIGTGGNTGAQTVSTIVRGLAVNDIRTRDSWRVLMRELLTGLLLGLPLGVVAVGIALLLGNSFALGAVVGLSIVAVCTWANVAGGLVPLAARRFGLDPALVSAPLITTLVDATGLAIYLTIARVVLGL